MVCTRDLLWKAFPKGDQTCPRHLRALPMDDPPPFEKLAALEIRAYPQGYAQFLASALLTREGWRHYRLKNRRAHDVPDLWGDRAEATVAPTRIGRPRNTEAPAYMLEMERRSRAGELEPTASAEARVLRQCMLREHPGERQPAVTTIRMNITPRFKEMTRLASERDGGPQQSA